MADISVTSGYDGLNLPYSPEAEQSVLGAVLLDSSCLDRIAEILPRAEYFHLANHRMLCWKCSPWASRWISSPCWTS